MQLVFSPRRRRAVLVAWLVVTLPLATSCATRQPGQSDAEYMAQRLDEVLTYTEPLLLSVPVLVQQWEQAGVITSTRGQEIRRWQQASLVLVATARRALQVYREAQTPGNAQAVAQLLPEVLALMSQAVLLMYGGP